MYERIRDKMRAKVRSLDYVMTIHAEEEMENDGLSILDVEEAILNGTIVERQRDVETGEFKYLWPEKHLMTWALLLWQNCLKPESSSLLRFI